MATHLVTKRCDLKGSLRVPGPASTPLGRRGEGRLSYKSRLRYTRWASKSKVYLMLSSHCNTLHFATLLLSEKTPGSLKPPLGSLEGVLSHAAQGGKCVCVCVCVCVCGGGGKLAGRLATPGAGLLLTWHVFILLSYCI